jgi:hypothetical protein
MTRLLATALAVGAALLVGCQASDAAYAPGQLGNGGFYFSCDDAVACARYSNLASQFPKTVALGSTFAVGFVPTSSSGSSLSASPEPGVTVQPVSSVYVSRGASGLAAIKAGYATLASRDAAGQLVDYVVLRVARPDALSVYAADDLAAKPSLVSTITLARGDTRAFRAFAQEKKENLAGSLQVEWTSSAPGIVAVESTAQGKVTIAARAAGKATLTATGGTFTQSIPVEVTP